jgi:hypothetical protein
MPRPLLALAMVLAMAAWVVPVTGEAQRNEPGPEDWWGPRSPEWERIWPREMAPDRW